MGQNRRATPVLFGIDFQINAAIVLMIENIKELKTLRIESDNEDIDIELENGKHILAQAKSVEKASSDFRNVKANLKKALETLSEGTQKVVTEKLILITNSPNPLNEEQSRSAFYGHAHRPFESLPDSSKEIIRSYLSGISQPLDPEQFHIQVIPFETDDERERYKTIWYEIDHFIGDLNLNNHTIGRKLHHIWKNDLFFNGSQEHIDIKLTKKSLVWPIIVITTDISQMEMEMRERFDPGIYDDVVYNYQNLIDSCCERFEFFSKILFDYNNYNHLGRAIDKCIDFVNAYWMNYASDFEGNGLNSETVEALTKAVVYNVIRRRLEIDKIKQGVSL